MAGGKKQGQLEINQAEIFAAAATERGTKPIERFSRAKLRGRNERLEFFAGLELAHRLDDERMAWQRLVECFENGQRFLRRAVARNPASVGFDNPQSRRVELVGVLKTLAGILLVAREIIDHTRVQVLEDRVPLGAREPIDSSDGALCVIGAIKAPGRKQCGGKIGNRSTNRLREIAAGGGILLVL